jgi:RNA polymerase sigma-70 factor (ECF subfamily)
MTFAGSDSAGGCILPALVDSPLIIANRASELEQPPTISELTARMARSDEAAFHEFYRLYFNRLLRYLLVVANGQEETAREALQLTFLRVARHVRRFESEPAFWNWLTVLARSSIADEMRKRTRYQNLLARFLEQQPASADLKSRDADEHFLKLLQDEIARLPAAERSWLERKYFDGETVKALAAEQQTTETAMESRLLRIRQKLKTAILDRLKNETTD